MIKKVLAFNVTNIHCKSRDVYGMKVCDRKERLLDYADYLITLAINRNALKFDWLKTERKGNKCYGKKFVHWSRNMQILNLFRVSSDMSTNK